MVRMNIRDAKRTTFGKKGSLSSLVWTDGRRQICPFCTAELMVGDGCDGRAERRISLAKTAGSDYGM